MLEEFIINLRVTLLVLVFLGFIVFGALVLSVEYKLYKKYIQGWFVIDRIIYYLAALATLYVLVFIYRMFFQTFRPY